MIVSTAIATVPPEARAAIISAFLQFSKVARTLPGVITHRYYADLEHENTIRVYAEYQNEEVWENVVKLPQHSIALDVMKAHGVTAQGTRYTATPVTDNS